MLFHTTRTSLDTSLKLQICFGDRNLLEVFIDAPIWLDALIDSRNWLEILIDLQRQKNNQKLIMQIKNCANTQ